MHPYPGMKTGSGTRWQLRRDPACLDLLFPLCEIQGKDTLIRYHQTFLDIFKVGTWKPTNLSKQREVRKSDEATSVLLECLLEAYHIYMPIALEGFRGQTHLKYHVCLPVSPRYCKKIKRTFSELMVVAQKVFNNKEDP